MRSVLIIGAGLTGIVCARELAEKGFQVRVMERRFHIGGNIYDTVNEDGFRIQLYGPHCFYTNDQRIRPYIERFTDTMDCFAHCKTIIRGKKIPMPFNYSSIRMIYGDDKADVLIKKLEDMFIGQDTAYVTDLVKADDEMIAAYGNYMYENEYRRYTAKQWGREIEDISPEIFNRVPVYLSDCDTYQSAKYQFIPTKGYEELAKKMLQHENIECTCDTDALDGYVDIKADRIITADDSSGQIPVIYTGELDRLFDYKYGRLPYRSLEFIWKRIDMDEYQDTEIVAYPFADKITRITEYKKLPPQKIKGKTVISIEIPFEYAPDSPVGNEPYYPIKNPINDALYNRYYEEANNIKNLYVCGRLGEFKYYNMDDAIRRAWEVSSIISEKVL